MAEGVAIVEADPARRWHIYREGALMVGRTAVPVGCLSWSGPPAAV